MRKHFIADTQFVSVVVSIQILSFAFSFGTLYLVKSQFRTSHCICLPMLSVRGLVVDFVIHLTESESSRKQSLLAPPTAGL